MKGWPHKERTSFCLPHTTDLYGVNYSMGSSGYSDAGVTGGSTHRKLVMQTRGRFSWVRDVKEKECFLHKQKPEVWDPSGFVRVPG